MLRQQLIQQPIFSVWLASEETYKASGGGSILFGGIDESKFNGRLSWIGVRPNATYWEVPLTKICHGKTDKKNLLSSSARAVIDTGTSLIVGPTATVERIHRRIGGFSVGKLWLVPCARRKDLPDLWITLGSTTVFNLRPTSYILPLSLTSAADADADSGLMSKVICVSALTPLDVRETEDEEAEPSPIWILGDVFLRPYYTAYDLGRMRIGFGQSRHGH